MREHHRRELVQIARFLFLGGVNSLTSIGLYALLQQVLYIPASYALAYLCGISLSALLSGGLVFGVDVDNRMRRQAFFAYLGVFLVGLGLVWLLQAGVRLSPLAAGFWSVTVTAPANYLVGRWAFTQRAQSSGSSIST